MIPEIIQQAIVEYCRKNGGVRVDIHLENNPLKTSGLFFDINGNAKLLSGNVTLIQYLTNHLKYTKESIVIKVNGKDLKEIVPIMLPSPKEPETINLENT